MHRPEQMKHKLTDLSAFQASRSVEMVNFVQRTVIRDTKSNDVKLI